MPESPPRQDQRVLAGRYRLVRALARGGMAEVWEAHDDRLDRPVAVKVLHPHLATDPDFLERFRREAIAAARLVHPGVVATFDAGIDGDTAFIVMEIVRGTDVRGLLQEKGGTLSCRAAVDIAEQAADALHYAHECGVVHRDVKPSNILCVDGRVKVADFGIAKTTESSELTRAGNLLGTAAYLSPEQVTGGVVDRRTDVYALGVVLYELLCGRPPFAGDGELATAVQRMTTEPVRPRQVRAGIPRPLEAVVLKALARDPEQRYATAADLRAALLAVDLADDDAAPMVDLDATPPNGIPPSFRQSERSWLTTAIVIVAVAVVLGVVGLIFASTHVGKNLFDDTPDSSSAAPATGSVHVASVRSFDPQSDGTEHEELTGNVIDGKPDTAWHTQTYYGPFKAPKTGVGLILTLDDAAKLKSLEVTSPTTDWAASIYVGDTAATTLEGWGKPVTSKSGLNGNATFDLGGAHGKYVLFWLTQLGPPGGGSLQATIDEIKVVPA